MKLKSPFTSRSALRFFTIAFPLAAHASELVPPSGTVVHPFGNSVALSGDIAIVAGSMGAGGIYQYRNLDGPEQTVFPNAQLLSPNGSLTPGFGLSVAASGTIGLVGYSEGNLGNGTVFLYQNLDHASGPTNADTYLVATDNPTTPFANSAFGQAVSLSGSNGLVSAPQAAIAGRESQGAAYFYRNLDSASGPVSESVKLIASDGAAQDFFGRYGLSLSGNKGLVSSQGGSSLAPFQGAVYLFRDLDSAIGTVTENARLIASDGAANDFFGISSSLSGNLALAGAASADVGSNLDQGSAYLFRGLDAATGTVTEQAKLVASDGTDGSRFGSSVSLSGEHAIVGAPGAEVPFIYQNGAPAQISRGAVYVFDGLEGANGIRTEQVKLFASDPEAIDSFGCSVALDGDRFAIGALAGSSSIHSYTGKVFVGSLGSVTTLDEGYVSRTIDGISFISRTDWVIGKNTDYNEVTLNNGNKAWVTTAGTAVYIGREAGSDFNTLTIEGTLTTDTVQVGSRQGSTGNTLFVRGGTLETGSIAGYSDDYHDNRLFIDGSFIRFTRSDGISGFKAGEIQIGNHGASFDTGDHTVVVDSAMSAGGDFEKIGTGTLEINGENIFKGPTIIREGTLHFGNLAGAASISGSVGIASGATLSGNGVIDGNLHNGGIITPGNSPGEILVNGDFRQNSSGSLFMEIASPDDYDVLRVSGATHLGGRIVISNQSTELDYGQSFIFVRGAIPVSSSFDSVTLIGFHGFRTVLGAGGLSLTLAPKSYTQVATNRNESSLAAALDTWVGLPDDDTTSIVNELDRLDAAGYRAAFAAISPSIYEAARSIAVEQSQGRLRLLGQHLDSRRLLPDVEAGTQWDVWAIGSGQYSSGSMTPVDGDSFASGGFLTGADRKVAPGTTAGAFTGYGYGQGEFPGRNEIEQNSLVLGGYATYERDGFHANAVMGAGILDSDVSRTIRFGSVLRPTRSETDGSEFFTSVSGGYDFHEGNWTFGPTGALQYSRVSYDSVNENGAGALDLHIDDTSDNSLRSMIGGRAAYLVKVSDVLTLVPEARLFWQHEFLRDTETLQANLSGGGSPNFAYQTADSDGDSVFTGVGVGFQTLYGISGNLSYDVELGREGDANQALSLGVDWKF